MRLKARCIHCKTHYVSFHSSVNDRGELAQKKGKSILMTCKNCHKKQAYHPNDFKAESSLTNSVGGIILLGLSSLLVGYLLYRFNQMGYLVIGGIFLLPGLVYSIYKTDEIKKIKAFNRFKVKP